MSKTAGPHAGNKMAVSGKAGSTHKMTKSKTTGANHSNGLITSPAAAVSATDALDECPPLVSSDEEEVEVAETADAMVWRWMLLDRTTDKLKTEVKKIREQGVGLFLLGMDRCAPAVWISAMVEVGAVDKEWLGSVDEMSKKQELMADLFKDIFIREEKIFFPGEEKLMKQVVELMRDVEGRCVVTDTVLVDPALDTAMMRPFFMEEWNEISQLEGVKELSTKYYGGRNKKPIIFTLLFFYKLVHHHVSYYASHKGMRSDQIVRDLINSDGINHSQERLHGNDFFKEKNYKDAIKKYTAAMRKDYKNYLLYGNRAQSYIFLKEYWKAYCDCKRAMFVNEDWYKVYYRAAEACQHLDMLKEAFEYNQSSQQKLRGSGMDETERHHLIHEIKMQRLKIIKALQVQGQSDALKDMMAIDLQDELSSKMSLRPEPQVSNSQQEAATGNSQPDSKRTTSNTTTNRNNNNSSVDRSKVKADTEWSREGTVIASRPQELSDTDRLSLTLREALEAYNLDNLVRATGKYQAALCIISNSDTLKSSVGEDTLLVVRYAFAITAVCQDRLKSELQEGLQTFQSLHREEVDKNFPLVLYGLCRGLVAFYRFPEAREVAERAVTKVKRKKLREVCWPQSQQVIEESKPHVFLRVMEQLRSECVFPPRPDAVCFAHADLEENKYIYTCSPTYVGLVTMSCYERCHLFFHNQCWKEYKNQFSSDKVSDKEMVDEQCPTPDCGSFVSSIVIEKSGKKHVFKSDQKPPRQPRPHKAGRVPPSSQRTLARRQERKELRRQRRAEVRRAKNLQPPSHSNGDRRDAAPHLSHTAAENTAGAVPNTASMTVLQKEEGEDMKYNTFQNKVRQKKKKEKASKQPTRLAVEVSFADDPDREKVGGFDAIDEGDVDMADLSMARPERPPRLAVVAPPDVDFTVPPQLSRPLESFSTVVASTQPKGHSPWQKDQDIKQILKMESKASIAPSTGRQGDFYGYLQDILKENGPQNLKDISSREEFQDIPEESSRIIHQFGGLRQYFEKHCEFVVHGDYVGVASDSHRVRHLADFNLDPSAREWQAADYSLDSSQWSAEASSHQYNGATSSSWLPSQSIDSVAGLDSFTDKPYADCDGSAYVGRSAREMTLPRIEHGLNPSAPEFQPSQVSDSRNLDRVFHPPSHPQVSATSSSLLHDAAFDAFGPSADDREVDDCEKAGWVDVNDIDEVDLGLSASSNQGSADAGLISGCSVGGALASNSNADHVLASRSAVDHVSASQSNVEDTVNTHNPVDVLPGHNIFASDTASRRSSQSDLSQCGSDLSTSALYRTASPSSSASSHRASTTRDPASPLSVRDSASPAAFSRLTDLTRKTASPAGSSSTASPSLPVVMDTPTSDLSLGSRVASSQHDEGLEESGQLDAWSGEGAVDWSNLPPPPKPLRPLSSSSSRLAGGAVAMVTVGLSFGGAAAPVSVGVPARSESEHVFGAVAPLNSSLPGESAGVPFTTVSCSTWTTFSSLSSSSSPLLSSTLMTSIASSFTSAVSALPSSSRVIGMPSSVSSELDDSFSSVLSSSEGFSSTSSSMAGDRFTAAAPSLIGQGHSLSAAAVDGGMETRASTNGRPPAAVSSAVIGGFPLPSSSSSGFLSQSLSVPSDAAAFPYSPSSISWGEARQKTFPAAEVWPNNSFPSAIRPGEEVVPPFTPLSAGFPPSASSLLQPPLPYDPFNWSTSDPKVSTPWSTSDSAAEVRNPWSTSDPVREVTSGWLTSEPSGQVGRRGVEEREVQVGVETREAQVNTHMTQHDVSALLDQQQSLSHLLQQRQQLQHSLEQLTKELQVSEDQRQALTREVEEKTKDLTKAVTQLHNLESDNIRLKDEQEAIMCRLRSDLQSMQNQNQLSAMENAGLLQKVKAAEDGQAKERSRAVKAELQVLHEQKQNFKMTVTARIKEVEWNRKECTMAYNSYQRAHPDLAPPESLYKDIMQYDCQLIEALSSNLQSILTQLTEHKEQILAGRNLAELSPVSTTTLPPKPPSLTLGPNNLPVFNPAVGDGRQSSPSSSLPLPTAPLPKEPPLSAAMTPGVGVSSRPLGQGPPGLTSNSQPPPLRPLTQLRPSLGSALGLTSSSLGGTATVSMPTAKAPGDPPVAPAPLRPIAATKGLPASAVQRSTMLATAHPDQGATSQGVAGSGAGGVGVAAKPKAQSSFDRLMMVIQRNFPQCDRNMIGQCVTELRQAHNGSLSGLDLEFISRSVSHMLIARGIRPAASVVGDNTNTSNSNSVNATTSRRMAPPPGLSAAWSVEGLEVGMGGGRFQEEEDPCAICTDELSSAPVQTLDCGHRFHDQCIRKWFKQQTTCPKCRSFAPLQDDFPVLK